jgi:putative FmdB family regulatory protein
MSDEFRSHHQIPGSRRPRAIDARRAASQRRERDRGEGRGALLAKRARRYGFAMPLFDLACTACAHRWEDMVKSGESPPACPKCGSTATEKILSIGAAYEPTKLPDKWTYKGPKRRPP